MPRAKVKPQDRQRSAIACVQCKQSKIRCDAGTPCSACIKRGKETGCVYQPSLGPRSRRHSHVGVAGRTDRIDKSVQQHGGRNTGPRGLDDESERNGSADGSSSNDENSGPTSRMLLSSRFEKVYIGETASLSYLQFLRQIVKHRVGPCTFTEGELNNYMLEMEYDGLIGENDAISSLDEESKLEFAQVYLDASSGLLDLFEREDLLTSLPDPGAIDAPLDITTTYLVLAIGAQCRGSGPSDQFYSATIFSQAQKLAFETMLQDPSPRMVRHFLLMAFYMSGACHRNAAFMYLGVASRAATTLGMHRAEHYLDLAREDSHSRANIWRSLRGFDAIVNSILGRAGSLVGIQGPGLPALFDSWGQPESWRNQGLDAIFTLCPFMEELQSKDLNHSIEFTEDFLHRLQHWSKSLPAELRGSTDQKIESISPDMDRESFVAGTHMASVYYFTIILATRKFLTMHLLPRTRAHRHSHGDHTDLSDRRTSLAHVCLTAATSLARVGNNALKFEHMLNLMCLVKAWMFAAGLLLGYWLFANGPDGETEEAFEQARAVEKKISFLSPQAAHYYDILSSFSEAIALHQRQLTEERKRTTSKYMDNIFTVSETNAQPTASLVQDDGISDQSMAHGSRPTDADNMAGEWVPPLEYDPVMEADLPWAIMNDFESNLQPFTSFFDDVSYP